MTRLGALTPVILSLALSAGTAFAQATTGFGSAQDVKLPVEVTADQLSVDQKTGKATFSGKVLVGQGAMRLSADSVTVTYAAGGQQRISALLAEGNVTMVSGPDAAEARAQFIDGFELPQAADIADAIAFAIAAPIAVNISNMEILPTLQVAAGLTTVKPPAA